MVSCVSLVSLHNSIKNFKAGNVSNCYQEWLQLTSDPEILQIVRGDTISFVSEPPQKSVVKRCNVSKDTKRLMDTEIESMLQKEIIVRSTHENGEYLSPIFPVPKQDGGIRIILNLKKLNEYVEYLHFKMDNIKVVLSSITPNCYMASIDLKQAYHSVKIDESFQKYLKFDWDGLFQFTCYPNGLAPCPRKFTKLLKVPLSHLRELDHFIIGYLDDFFMKGKSRTKCENTIHAVIRLLQELGFTIHPDKSLLEPSNVLTFLGFVINSNSMTVTLTEEKKAKLAALIDKVLSKVSITIRIVASLIGKIVSSLPASLYGPLYYRTIEAEKNSALKHNKGNFEAHMQLSQDAIEEIHWWKFNLKDMHAPIQWPPITQVISTDASGKNGWGASMLGTLPIGGIWSEEQMELHINVKEMTAILYALRSFVDTIKNQHVKVLCDNTTSVFVLNKMGTTKSPECNTMAKEIWKFCMENGIFITCAYIPGKENVVADKASRKKYKQGEWMLNKNIFQHALSYFDYSPNIDCFATRANAQLDIYASRDPDPYATHIDAFALNWSNFNTYLFPPFSLINRVLQKVRIDRATALCVVPKWTTQAWWPQILEMMVADPMIIPPDQGNLVLPNKKGESHPLHKKLSLVICLISGKNIGEKDSPAEPQS